MSQDDFHMGKKRTAHLPILQVDLRSKLQRLKTRWKESKEANLNPRAPSTHLSLMKQKAKELISKQQLRTPAKQQQPARVRKLPLRRTKAVGKTQHQKFMQRLAKKHPEIIALHAPPMTFYHPNRSFESRPALRTEETFRREEIHRLCAKYHVGFMIRKKYNVKDKIAIV